MASGRLTKYTSKIADEIIRRMSEGESLSKICESDSIPTKGAVLSWVTTNRNGFFDRYDKAFKVRAYSMLEDLIDLSDDDEKETNRSRLQVDTRKWIVSKMIPKFSDKPDNTDADDAEPVDSITYVEIDASKPK